MNQSTTPVPTDKPANAVRTMRRSEGKGRVPAGAAGVGARAGGIREALRRRVTTASLPNRSMVSIELLHDLGAECFVVSGRSLLPFPSSATLRGLGSFPEGGGCHGRR